MSDLLDATEEDNNRLHNNSYIRVYFALEVTGQKSTGVAHG